MQNVREFSRSPIDATVNVVPLGREPLSGHLHDVSMNGIYFITSTPPPEQTDCAVTIVLEGGAEQVRIHADGVVARQDAEGAAIEFCDIDVDSIDHLRNLVLYNAPNVDQAEDEIRDHLGLKRP